MKVLKEFVFSFLHYIPLHRWKKIGHFRHIFLLPPFLLTYYMVCYASKSLACIKICYTHFDYRENKRVCSKFAADDLCKTKWRQIYHDFGNRYHGPNGWRRLLLGYGDEVEHKHLLLLLYRKDSGIKNINRAWYDYMNIKVDIILVQ